MLFDWFDAREATTMATTLADDFVTQAASESRPKNAGLDTRSYLEKFAQRFLTRVDREARPLKLNLFKRAKLANSFKWRLLEKGVERDIADELTHALLLRLSAGPQPAGPGLSNASRAARGTVLTLLAEGNQALARAITPRRSAAMRQPWLAIPGTPRRSTISARRFARWVATRRRRTNSAARLPRE